MPNMKSTIHAIAAVLIFAAIPASLLAQWPPYPTPGVPKLADGKPNLEGPAPRTPDGKPDFSGIWQFEGNRRSRPPAAPGVIGGSGPGPTAAPGAAATTPPAPPTPPAAGSVGLGPRPPGVSEFFDIGSTVKDG